MPESNIAEVHERLGAQLLQIDGISLPEKYSSVEEECLTVRKSSALFDISHFGRVLLTGKDSLEFLNRISTNDLNGLRPGMGKQTFLTTEKGRIVDLCTAYQREEGILLLTSPGNSEKVMKWMEKFIVSEDVKVRDVSGEVALFLVAGPMAPEFLKETAYSSYKTFLDIEKMRRNDFIKAFVGSREIVLSKSNLVMMNGYLIMVISEFASGIWEDLVYSLRKLGGTPAGLQTFEVLRIENGTPVFPNELNEDVNPLEVNLLDAVHNNKGCYIGQEVIARLQTYDKVRKRLVGLLSTSKLPHGGKIFDQKPADTAGTEIGVVTSSVKSPGLGKEIALGYLSVKHLVPGSKYAVKVGSRNVEAELSSLPFLV